MADEAFKHHILSRSSETRKPLRAFIIIIIYYKRPHIIGLSRYLRDDAAREWIITKFSGSTLVRRPSAVNTDENSYTPHNAVKSQFIGHIFVADSYKPTFIQSRMASSEIHNIRITSSVPSVKCTLSCTGHSRSLKVIIIGACINSERCVVVMCN